MCRKSKKTRIQDFCKKLVMAQKAYASIGDDTKNRHLSFPDVIQKQILIEFCDLNLSLRVPDSIDLEDKITKESYELKSTTSYDGAETISQIQAQNADYLIWMFVDFSRYQIEVRIPDLRDPTTRQEVITCSNKQSFAIKKLFDKKKLKDEFTLKMSNLKIMRKNV